MLHEAREVGPPPRSSWATPTVRLPDGVRCLTLVELAGSADAAQREAARSQPRGGGARRLRQRGGLTLTCGAENRTVPGARVASLEVHRATQGDAAMSQLISGRAMRTAAAPEILVFPGDPVRRGAPAWNLAVDQRPPAVALPRPSTTLSPRSTTRATVGLRVAVQGTGHGAGTPSTGHCS